MDEKDKPNEEEGAEDNGAKPDDGLGEAGKRAIQQERKMRAAAEKRLKELEAEAKTREDAEKTEVDRLKGQVADLTKDAEAAKAQVVRFEVAAAKGLTPAQARRLVGTTKEELEEDADSLRADLGLKDEKPEEKEDKTEEEGAFGAKPVENLRSGSSNEEDQEADPAKVADSILSSGW